MKRILTLIGIILLVGAAAWKFAVSPRWEQRFPDGWTWDASFLGTSFYLDENTTEFPNTQFPKEDPVNLSSRNMKASAQGVPAGQVEISDYYATRDAATNAVTWEFTFKAIVDATTGKYVDPKFKDDYFLFPRNVQKQATYRIRNSSYQGLPTTFQGEENVGGIVAYNFAYVAKGVDNAAAYVDTKLEDGQAILCDAMELRFWVEPVTGEVVRYKEGCSGDYIVEKATGKRIRGLSRWSGETTGDDLIKRVTQVQGILNNYRLMTSYIPLGLLVVGLVLLGVAWVPGLVNRKH